MKALFMITAILSLSLGACAKKTGQDHGELRTRSMPATAPMDGQAAQTPMAPREGHGKTAAEEIAPNVHVISVAALRAGLRDHSMQAVDANSQRSRDELGVITGAIPIDGGAFNEFELPSDRDTHLVFYCSNSTCTAAPHAALLALEYGYREVSILGVGIRGWIAEGGETESTD